MVNDEEHLLFKDPVTDDGTKKSARGLLLVTRDATSGELILLDGMSAAERLRVAKYDAMRTVYSHGGTCNRQSFATVRAIVKSEVIRRGEA